MRHPALRTAACDLLGIRYPIVQTGMGWVSTPELTAATANAGGLGILAGATLTVAETEGAIARTRELTAAPFGVNLRGDSPDLPERARLLIKHGVRVASFGLAPDEAVIRELTEAGLVVMPTIGARRHAEKVAALGATAVVAQGSEGGGHTGGVPTSILLPQVTAAVSIPVFGAGGFCDGRGLVAALAYGAAGIAMGTRFLLTRESPVPGHVKQEYLRRGVTRHLVTTVLDGVPQRVLRTELADRLVRGGPLSRLARSAAARGRVQEDVRHVLAGPGPRGSRHETAPRPVLARGHHGREHPHDAPREHGRRAHRPGHARERAGGRRHRRPAELRRAHRADHGRGRRGPHPAGPAGGFLMAPQPQPHASHGLLAGKTVVVTAAAGTGIGFATARRCAEEGARVAISDVHERRLGAAASELALIAGEKPLAITCDVTVEDDVRRLFDTVAAEYGRIDVAVNNAGLGGDTPLAEMTDEQWLRVLDVTLNGTFRCTRAALRHMLPRGSGAIVNNASVVGWRAQAGQAHYAAAKAGVMALTRCAAIEAAPRGVRVNAVAPSIAMHPHLAKVSSEELLTELAAREAFGRAAEPWEVADVIVFLASGYSSYMTGEIISVSSQHP